MRFAVGWAQNDGREFDLAQDFFAPRTFLVGGAHPTGDSLLFFDDEVSVYVYQVTSDGDIRGAHILSDLQYFSVYGLPFTRYSRRSKKPKRLPTL